MPPLVFAGEARSLLDRLADVVEGKAFVLQAGDCAESFHDWNAPNLREKLKIILQMSAVLTYAASLPVVKVGRIAGQFVKPRSEPTEIVGDLVLPTFRGHIVHGDEPTVEARTPDPGRMLQGYHQAASTLNLLRAFTKGGYADLGQVHAWTQEFVANSPEGRRYEQLAERDPARDELHVRDRRRHAKPGAPPDRHLDEPRGAAARLRGGADQTRLADRRLVRLLGPLPLDRRADTAPGRRPRRVPRRRAQPASGSSWGRRQLPGRRSRSARRSTRGACRAG